jgi:hypothetical protein
MTERDLHHLIGTGHRVIVTGDVSTKQVKWCTRQNKAAGQSLRNHYHKNNYIISAPTQPTYFRDRNPAGAESFSNIPSSHSVRLGSLSTSDHSPVLLSIHGPLKADEIKLNCIYREGKLGGKYYTIF